MIALAAGIFIVGVVLGSFVSALAHRLPRGENWISDRSRCPDCGAQIPARDNIPLVSWLALRGRCRACGEPISIRYPLAELGTGTLMAATYLIVGDDDAVRLALGLALCPILVAITLTDLDLRVIPNKLVLAGSIAAIAILAVGEPDLLPDHALAAAIGGGALFLVVMAYPRGMGMGDAKLVGMMGLFLGRALAPGVLIGFAAGAIVGVAMIARHGSAARKQAIPFGPFLALGGVLAIWFGDDMVQSYLDEFFPEE